MVDSRILLYISVFVVLLGLVAGIVIARTNGYIDFIKARHIYSLLLIVLAGIFTWFGMVWITKDNGISITRKEWISLVMSILISILWWGRYVYIVDKSEDLINESEEVKK